MKAAITITGHESNYEGDEKGWVNTPTRLQITEDFEYPGMEGRYFKYQYKQQGKSRYVTRRAVHVYNNAINVLRFQDTHGYVTEVIRNKPGDTVRIGIQPERKEVYNCFMSNGGNSFYSFEINKSQFTKAEKYLRSMEV